MDKIDYQGRNDARVKGLCFTAHDRGWPGLGEVIKVNGEFYVSSQNHHSFN